MTRSSPTAGSEASREWRHSARLRSSSSKSPLKALKASATPSSIAFTWAVALAALECNLGPIKRFVRNLPSRARCETFQAARVALASAPVAQTAVSQHHHHRGHSWAYWEPDHSPPPCQPPRARPRTGPSCSQTHCLQLPARDVRARGPTISASP